MATFTPGTAATGGSPASSILLPPAEIPDSPARSFQSAASYHSDASHRGHYPESERHSDYDESVRSDYGRSHGSIDDMARESEARQAEDAGSCGSRTCRSLDRRSTMRTQDSAGSRPSTRVGHSISFSGADYSLKDLYQDTFSEKNAIDRTAGASTISTKGGGGRGEGSGGGPSTSSSGGMRKSASTRSISVRRKSWFARMRRSPNFTLFTVFLALFIDMATYGIIVPIIPFIVSDRMHGSAVHTGMLLAVYALGMLIASPLFGTLGDYFVSRRVPMLIGLVGMLASTVFFMLASNIYILILARLLQGMAGGSVWTLGLALIADVFPTEALGVQMGKALIGYTLGLMMGPPLGGLLYDYGGYRAPFYFCCSITVVDILCRSLVIEEREEIVLALRLLGKRQEAVEEAQVIKAQRKSERLHSKHVWWQLLRSKRLLACIIITACGAFVFSGAEPTMPLQLARKYNLNAEKIGLVFMAFSLPTMTGPLWGALSDSFGAKAISLVSLVLCSASVLLLGIFQDSLPLSIVLFTLIGTTGTAVLTPILAEISAVVRNIGTDSFAMAYALFNMAFSLGVMVGPIVCGVLYERVGFHIMTYAMVGVLFVAVPVTVLWIGGRAQKRRDIAKYREDEEIRRAWREQGRRHGASASSLTKSFSRYSLELADQDAVLYEDSPVVMTSHQQNVASAGGGGGGGKDKDIERGDDACLAEKVGGVGLTRVDVLKSARLTGGS
ncbi:hypothetical protein DFQ27_000970 [Actinomortierella ambigua]|uniref:Major facilitator superfamily (MFS) profile domain-containing protein n=1 Tax=Actinomortierella ambigua TaxID=1343610 RepID=A0A9P6UCU1_9FUNG|nr:hypothetical protein DFQ27_000970 [Actinomortierella ambigua]